MTFEQFQKNLKSSIDPDRAYKLYLQTKLAILEEVVIAATFLTRESLDNIEEKVFKALTEEFNK